MSDNDHEIEILTGQPGSMAFDVEENDEGIQLWLQPEGKRRIYIALPDLTAVILIQKLCEAVKRRDARMAGSKPERPQ